MESESINIDNDRVDYFVDKNSIVRQIWGKSDTILFIFAGAAAEFALSKAVDWLYFTGKLPADPIGRLFSTVTYARNIVFSEKEKALKTIDAMTAIHNQVEVKRGEVIPNWAYRHVLSMLIDYSIRAFEVLERKLTDQEKNEVFQVFIRLGNRMGISGLPESFDLWFQQRNEDLTNNLQHSHYTRDLFIQYRKHLGVFRYRLLVEAQILVLPKPVGSMLGYRATSPIKPLLDFYKLCKRLNTDKLLKDILLPSQYKKAVLALDV